MGDTLRMRHAVEANTIARGPLTWQLYLVIGFFQFVLNLQGNIFPFLKVELDISYRTIGFHPTAFACGIILVGLFGPRVISRFGRRWMLMLGVFGFATAAVLLCLAHSGAGQRRELRASWTIGGVHSNHRVLDARRRSRGKTGSRV